MISFVFKDLNPMSILMHSKVVTLPKLQIYQTTKSMHIKFNTSKTENLTFSLKSAPPVSSPNSQ